MKTDLRIKQTTSQYLTTVGSDGINHLLLKDIIEERKAKGVYIGNKVSPFRNLSKGNEKVC